MSLAARLYLDNDTKGIKITSCDFNLNQDVDSRGQMSSIVRLGLVHVTVPGTVDTDLLNWMVTNQLKKCTIKFSGFVDTGQPRTIEFENAALVGYHESFSEPMDTVVNLTIAYEKIKIKGVEKSMNWDLSTKR
jgi:hypothetical protein